MTATLETRRRRGGFAQGLGLLSLLLIVAGPALAHAGLPPLAGLDVFLLAGVVGLVAVILAVIALFRGSRRRALVGLVLGALPLATLALAAHSGAGMPAINDITTDLAAPPHFLAHDHPYPEPFKAVVRKSYPEVQTLHLTAAPAEVYEAALALAKAWPRWEIVDEDPKDYAFQAVATTRLFRFKDDVVVRIAPGEGGGSKVDMRSRSRVGKGDLGTNAKRIRAFFDALAARLGGAVS